MLYCLIIVNRLIINSHERVIPDWDIRKIRGLFFEIKTRPNFNQFFGSTISSEAASVTFRLPVISKLALYFARKTYCFLFLSDTPQNRSKTGQTQQARLLRSAMMIYFQIYMRFSMICATIPAASCECDRSASSLRRLHAYNRACMGQERLSSLALMHVHYQVKIVLDEVVNCFG